MGRAFVRAAGSSRSRAGCLQHLGERPTPSLSACQHRGTAARPVRPPATARDWQAQDWALSGQEVGRGEAAAVSCLLGLAVLHGALTRAPAE